MTAETPSSPYTALRGRRFPAADAAVDAQGIREFAQAIGDENPLYRDVRAAQAAGYHDIVAPPTYAFILKYKVSPANDVLAELGVHEVAGKLLHAEQSFDYHAPICAGDRLRFEEHVEQVYEKRGGALVFFVLETAVTNQDKIRVATIRHTEVLRTDA